jgi:hypothetical protein
MMALIKKWSTFTVLICPNGVAILLIGVIIEILYNLCTALGFLGNSLELLALSFGLAGFYVLFSFKRLVYFAKKKIGK